MKKCSFINPVSKCTKCVNSCLDFEDSGYPQGRYFCDKGHWDTKIRDDVGNLDPARDCKDFSFEEK